MKTWFKLAVFCSLFFVVLACSSKRPDGDSFSYVLKLQSILKNATVTVEKKGEILATSVTDENGETEIDSLSEIGDLTVKVCGGTADLVSAELPVAWNGCLSAGFNVANEENVSVIVDFLTAFIMNYNSKTAKSEWFSYLDISTDAAPKLQTSLTDATKRFIWSQALAKAAQNVSIANSASPETQYSTENLLNLLYDDLRDDSVINGSTSKTFGSLNVNSSVLKGVVADLFADVSKNFSKMDLAYWADKIRNSNAKFLGADASNEGITITLDVYPEGEKGASPEFFSDKIAVEASAESGNKLISFECFADDDKITDEKEEIPLFYGVFDSLALGNEKREIKIKCIASDGTNIEEKEVEISVDNTIATIKADFFERGTLIKTGSVENPAKNFVDLVVTANHSKYSISDITCVLPDYPMTNLSDENNRYKALIDTTKLKEGKNKLSCVATFNQLQNSADFDFYVKNEISINVKPYIANELRDVESISSFCGEDFSSSGDTEKMTIVVKTGAVCKIIVSGGSYLSQTLSKDENDFKQFSGELTAVIIPNSTTQKVVLTPITTIEEYVYSARKAAEEENSEVYAASKMAIESHYSKAFSLFEEPQNTKSMDPKTQYFVALAGLEYLAYFVEIANFAEHGVYTIFNILSLLQKDYQDLTFDGKGSEGALILGEGNNSFKLDPNFFRYYYAISIKRFLESDFNTTGLTQFNSLISGISTNTDQFLFPADSDPIEATSGGPLIVIKSYKNLFEKELDNGDYSFISSNYEESDEKEYSLEMNKKPYYSHAFIINFDVSPKTENQFLNLASVKITNDAYDFKAVRLEPVEILENDVSAETVSFSFFVEYEGSLHLHEIENSFFITAEDIAFNKTSQSLSTFWDSKKPIVEISVPSDVVNLQNVFVKVKVTENKLGEGNVAYKLKKDGKEIFSDFSYQKEFEISKEFILNKINEKMEPDERDGKYVFTVTVVDAARNETVREAFFTLDSTPPLFNNDVIVEANGKVIEELQPLNTNKVAIKLKEDSASYQDIDSWSSKLMCYGYKMHITDREDVRAERLVENRSKTDSIDFDDLPQSKGVLEAVVCFAFVSVCDKVGNCSNENYDTLSRAFVIDASPPLPAATPHRVPVRTACMPQEGNSIFQRCITGPQCDNGAQFPIHVIGDYQPHILISYVDNFSVQSNLKVYMYISETGAYSLCSYVPNVENPTRPATCNCFYCDLQGGNDDQNNIMFKVFDEAGNCFDQNLTISLDMSAAKMKPVNINIDSFFTDKNPPLLTWEETEDIEYECKITKDKDPIHIYDCVNGDPIESNKLSGSGRYRVSVTSKSVLNYRTDVKIFNYFETADLKIKVDPLESKILSSGDNYSVYVNANSGGNAQIKKLSFYLYDRYKNGKLMDSDKYLAFEKSFEPSLLIYSHEYPSAINENISGALQINKNVSGSFKSLQVKITLADNTIITKDFPGVPQGSLFCLKSADENKNMSNVTMKFENDYLVANWKPYDCLTPHDYQVTIKTYPVMSCGPYDYEVEQKIDYDSNNFMDFLTKGYFKIRLEHVLLKKGPHEHGCSFFGGCDVEDHECWHSMVGFSDNTTGMFEIAKANATIPIKVDSSVNLIDKKSIVYFNNDDCDECEKCGYPLMMSCVDDLSSPTLIRIKK